MSDSFVIERTTDRTERYEYFAITGGPRWVDESTNTTREVVGATRTTTCHRDQEQRVHDRVLYRRVKKNGEFYNETMRSWSWDVPDDVRAAVAAAIESFRDPDQVLHVHLED